MVTPVEVEDGVPEKAEIAQVVRGVKFGESRQPVWHEDRRSKRVVEGDLKVEEPGENNMAVVSEAHTEDTLGWGGTRESGVENNGFPSEREGGTNG